MLRQHQQQQRRLARLAQEGRSPTLQAAAASRQQQRQRQARAGVWSRSIQLFRCIDRSRHVTSRSVDRRVHGCMRSARLMIGRINRSTKITPQPNTHIQPNTRPDTPRCTAAVGGGGARGQPRAHAGPGGRVLRPAAEVVQPGGGKEQGVQGEPQQAQGPCMCACACVGVHVCKYVRVLSLVPDFPGLNG